MKSVLAPVYFRSGSRDAMKEQVATLRRLLIDEAELLEPTEITSPIPESADAIVFVELAGEAYDHVDALRRINIPMMIVTSEFGTMSTWDWEIIDYLKAEGIETITPYHIDQTRCICRALRARRALRGGRFLAFQDNPGEGAQAGIFKRFYWWKDQCIDRMKDKFGLNIEKRSFRQLGAEAQEISDQNAERIADDLSLPGSDVQGKPLNSAIKLYLAIKQYLEEDDTIRAVGVNCLNESHFSDTTPCLAWNLLFQEERMIWGCEADTLSMLTMFLLHRSLDVPIMMTNLYPFLMGDSALKHERIPSFPDVAESPEDHVLVGHCGYMGVIPSNFATEWTLRKKVLAIVDDNATTIDARLPTGAVTLAKLHSSLDKMTIIEGVLEEYAGFANSDCLSGGVIRIRNGPRMITSLASHHYVLMTGHHLPDLRNAARVFGLNIEVL